MRCYWAHPEDYDHVAGKPEKLVSIVFTGDEVDDYNKLMHYLAKILRRQ